jgi:hypothetical protein
VAPKPPAQQLLNVKTNGRAVSRHHSMKSPRYLVVGQVKIRFFQ